MSYFLEEHGKQTGPVSQFQILTRIEEGRLTPQNLAWRPGMDHWRPLGEFEEFHPGFSARQLYETNRVPTTDGEDEEEAEPDLPEASPQGKTGVQDREPLTTEEPVIEWERSRPQLLMKRAWCRLTARLLDMLWMNFFFVMLLSFGLLSNVQWVSWVETHIMMILLLMMFFSTLLEATLLSIWGTTPGKFMMNLRVVTQEGERPRWQLLLSRSLLVWMVGMAMGLLPMCTIAMLMHYFWYMRDGTTVWDRMLGLNMLHRPIPLWRVMVVAGIFLIVFIINVSMSKQIMQMAGGMGGG